MPLFHPFILTSLLFCLPLSETAHPPLNSGTCKAFFENPAKTAYSLHIPPDFDTNYPTPLVLITSDTKKPQHQKEWEAQADRVGFVTVAFEGNHNLTTTDISGFLETLKTKFTLDPARLFVVCDTEAPLALHWNSFSAVFFTEKAPHLPSPTETAMETGVGQQPQAIWNFFDHHPHRTLSAVATTLTVTCTGLRSEKGQVLLSLFNSEAGFPDDEKRVFRTANATIHGTTATVTFPDLPPGDYACAFVHDENDNGSLDTSFGYPLEGFGVSSNPKIRFGAPRFSDARFYLAGDRAERRITMRTTYF